MIDRKDRQVIQAIRNIRLRWPGPRAGAPRASGARLRVAPGVRDVWSRFLVARLVWILLTTILVTASAGAFLVLQKPMYKSQATVAIYPAAGATSAVQPFVMGTEKGVASSGAVLSLASQSLLIPVTRLQSGLSITIPVDSDLLVISYSDPNPQVAQSAAEAIAQAYVAYRTTSLGGTNVKTGSPSTASLQAAVVTDATLPASPDNLNPLLTIGVALILGLALGLGLALVLDWLDDSVRGALDLEAQSNTQVLAQLPAVQRKRRGPADGLLVVDHPDSSIARAYANLRTRVLQAASLRQARVLLVTSPGREAGKTTVATNLAAAVALSGRRVALVVGEISLADALAATDVPGLEVLAGGPMWPVSSSIHHSRAFNALLKRLRAGADLVVIDGPPVLASADSAALAEEAGMVLLVADARISSRAEVRAAMEELKHVRDRVIGSVLANVGRATRLRMPSSQVAPIAPAATENRHGMPSSNGAGEEHLAPEIHEAPAMHEAPLLAPAAIAELIVEAADLDAGLAGIPVTNGVPHTHDRPKRRRHQGRSEE